MLRGRAELSLLAYDVSWEQAGVGPKHPALGTPSPGVTVEERHELVRRAMDELAAAGLAHRGRIDGDLLDTYTVLGCARREFYGWFTPDGVGEYAVVVAAIGEDAVIAVTDGVALALTPIRPTALAESLVLALPEVEPARDRSISVSRDALDALLHGAANPGSVLVSTGGSGGRHDADARRLLTVLQRPRTGGGQFFAACRDRFGARLRSRGALNHLDTAQGRTLLAQTSGGDGGPWILAIAGDDRQFAGQLHRLLPD